jgi:hypothetical protein
LWGTLPGETHSNDYFNFESFFKTCAGIFSLTNLAPALYSAYRFIDSFKTENQESTGENSNPVPVQK